MQNLPIDFCTTSLPIHGWKFGQSQFHPCMVDVIQNGEKKVLPLVALPSHHYGSKGLVIYILEPGSKPCQGLCTICSSMLPPEVGCREAI